MKQFRVYQLPVEHAAKFMSLDFVKENSIMPKLEDYKLVYEGEFEPQSKYSEPDQLYTKFQGEKPEGYTGHSISMSDVVEIDGEYFYCDDFGWENVTELFPKPTLRKGEKYECIKDYVMDDGSVAYKAGKVYEMLSDEFLGADESGSTRHTLSNERDFYLHFKKTSNETEEAKMIDLEENGNRCAGETPEMKVRIAEARRMKRYQELVNNRPGAMLLFRCGDFYETYYGDAITAAKVLGITLTYRQGFEKGHEIAGFPLHALDIYLPKLIRAGLRVAIVDE